MKIIKPGDLSRFIKIKRFECEWCGCIFEADNTEYQDCSTQRDGILYHHKCPYCKHPVYNREP